MINVSKEVDIQCIYFQQQKISITTLLLMLYFPPPQPPQAPDSVPLKWPFLTTEEFHRGDTVSVKVAGIKTILP